VRNLARHGRIISEGFTGGFEVKYVFGLVPSRRLGRSLGIDPVPLKTCNWNCVYCQLGRTIPLKNVRCEFFPREEIYAEITQALKTYAPGDIDWITFVGSGETSLHAGIGWLIRQVKSITSLPMAVITNGSLLYLPEIRRELSLADAVLPSLDAGNAVLYRKINRPHPQVTFEGLLDGLIAFRREYHGKLWVEVMLVRGLNDSEIELLHIAKALEKIKPDEIHLLQPDRPPVESWVQPTDQDGLIRAQAILGRTARLVQPATGSFDLRGEEDLLEAIVAIITRHPMREEELVKTLQRFSPEDADQRLAALEKSGKVQVVERYHTRFWIASPAYFPHGATE
jgi:wyosine [tRNA(Phe)-imidazoG37] synthetase (radical SAM superfamily)